MEKPLDGMCQSFTKMLYEFEEFCFRIRFQPLAHDILPVHPHNLCVEFFVNLLITVCRSLMCIVCCIVLCVPYVVCTMYIAHLYTHTYIHTMSVGICICVPAANSVEKCRLPPAVSQSHAALSGRRFNICNRVVVLAFVVFSLDNCGTFPIIKKKRMTVSIFHSNIV